MKQLPKVIPTPDPQAYANAKPFPYLVIDDVMDASELYFFMMFWPKEHESMLESKDQKLKHYTNSEKHMGIHLSGFIKTNFQSQQFILFLEELTGIKGLVMDIRGGYALHETMPGGKLMPHLDYLIHDVTGLQHRVNAILYLNEVEGGELELYQVDHAYGGTIIHKAVSIKPKFNRMVIFNINEIAVHGHPNPVIGAESRKSIALNYFSIPESKAIKQETIFFGLGKSKLKKFIPPIFYQLFK